MGSSHFFFTFQKELHFFPNTIMFPRLGGTSPAAARPGPHGGTEPLVHGGRERASNYEVEDKTLQSLRGIRRLEEVAAERGATEWPPPIQAAAGCAGGGAERNDERPDGFGGEPCTGGADAHRDRLYQRTRRRGLCRRRVWPRLRRAIKKTTFLARAAWRLVGRELSALTL